MGEAFKCDRCGNLQSGKPAGTLAFGQMPNQRLSKELCDECEDALDEFVDGASVNPTGDCRTERTAKDLGWDSPQFATVPTTDGGGYLSSAAEIKSFNVSIKKPLAMRRTCLKEQVDMGAKNY